MVYKFSGAREAEAIKNFVTKEYEEVSEDDKFAIPEKGKPRPRDKLGPDAL